MKMTKGKYPSKRAAALYVRLRRHGVSSKLARKLIRKPLVARLVLKVNKK